MALSFIPFAFPGLPRVGAVFTTAQGDLSRGNVSHRAGGDPPREVASNRVWLAETLGFSAWGSLKQVHGADMTFDPPAVDADQASGLEADGSATRQPGLALVIKTADCQPILLAHQSGECVAALHVGWRGNAQGFIQKGVAALCERYGFGPDELMAVRGPSLGPAASQFVNFAEEFGPDFAAYHDPASQTVNLWRLTNDQLLEAGLKPDRIFRLDLCTFSLPLFHSYRRDRQGAGRQAALVWIR
ncbi:polyphenol oxidase family protein [Fundidesulfovibrio butyratiphilus]